MVDMVWCGFGLDLSPFLELGRCESLFRHNNSFESCLWEKMKHTSSSGMYVDLRSEIFNSSLNIVS